MELLIALAITSLVAASMAAMITATTYGTTSGRSMRDVLVKGHVVYAHLNAEIRSALSAEVLPATGNDDCLVLWMVDSNGTKENSEMRLIERDVATDKLLSYQDSAAAGTYVNAATFRTQAKASYPTECWVTGVTAADFVADAAAPSTKLVSFRLTITKEDITETVIGAAALR